MAVDMRAILRDVRAFASERGWDWDVVNDKSDDELMALFVQRRVHTLNDAKAVCAGFVSNARYVTEGNPSVSVDRMTAPDSEASEPGDTNEPTKSESQAGDGVIE